jgi:hypothetical protein
MVASKLLTFNSVVVVATKLLFIEKKKSKSIDR